MRVTAKGLDELTRDDLRRYEAVRKSGLFNMMMQAQDAAECAGLGMETYLGVLKHYNALMEKFPGGAQVKTEPFDLYETKRVCATVPPGPWYQDDTHVTLEPSRVAPDVLKANDPAVAAFAVYARSALPQAVAVIERLAEALRFHDAYMADQFHDGPASTALHPKAAENWQRIRAALGGVKQEK